MTFNSTRLPYRQAGLFQKLVLDYLDRSEHLSEFYTHPPSLQGIKKALTAKKAHKVNRKLLVNELKKQYEGISLPGKLEKNITSLLDEKTFTITTAHQNNLFTGPLYFIYKIIHALKLADYLNETFSANHVVPVFYMGTEDADLAELNHIYLGNEKLEWKTNQSGAVGRMTVDKNLISLINVLEGQLSVLPFGEELIRILKSTYSEGKTIQQATFELLNRLFGDFGLVVLLPDNPGLKNLAKEIFREELIEQVSGSIVNRSVDQLEKLGYKTQAHPREINLFYLKDGIRERIEKQGENWKVLNTNLRFDKKELEKELEDHPERFSPNVILRGIYQELILPNIAFIGGGGELSYWLQYKNLFEHFKVPFPVLVLRNSFMIVEKQQQEIISRLGLEAEDFFKPETELMNKWLRNSQGKSIGLNGEFSQTEQLYMGLKQQISSIDTSLEKHVEALKTKTLNRLIELEKKMLRAERRKYGDQQRQIQKIRAALFPNGGLQERIANFLYYQAKWGDDFLNELLKHSLALEQEFTLLREQS